MSEIINWREATAEERLESMFAGDPIAGYAGDRALQKSMLDDEIAERSQSIVEDNVEIAQADLGSTA